MVFISREAALKAAGKEDKPDPTTGFEVLDGERLHDYFCVANEDKWYTLLALAWDLDSTTPAVSTVTWLRTAT